MVKKCAMGKRSTPSTVFYINGKPQIYCLGWLVYITGETAEECKQCPDWVYGKKCSEDYEKYLKGEKPNDG